MKHIPAYGIYIGPEDQAGDAFERGCNAFVSVADSFPKYGSSLGSEQFWYPIHECSNWGYGPFYWSKKILDRLFRKKVKTFVHCHGGVHRSPMIVYVWLRSLGHSAEEAVSLMGEAGYVRAIDYAYEQDIQHGYIPKHLDLLHKIMIEHSNYSLASVLIRIAVQLNLPDAEEKKLVLHH